MQDEARDRGSDAECMGQREVYDFLRSLRDTGDDRYYTASEVCKMLNEQGLACRPDRVAIWIRQLWYGNGDRSTFVERQEETEWFTRAHWRAKI